MLNSDDRLWHDEMSTMAQSLEKVDWNVIIFMMFKNRNAKST